MTPWAYRVDVSDFFDDETLSVNEKAKRIATRFRLRLNKKPIWEDEIEGLLEELEDQTSADDFNGVWSCIYDWCDGERVWIETR